MESKPTSASARGTGAFASRLIASSSIWGSFASASALPMGAEGAFVNRVTALVTTAASTAGFPPPLNARIVPELCARSPASAASARRLASTTDAGMPPSPSNRSAFRSSAMNSGWGSARNAAATASSPEWSAPPPPPASGRSLCSKTTNARRRKSTASEAAPRSSDAARRASLTRAKSEKRSSAGTPCSFASSAVVSWSFAPGAATRAKLATMVLRPGGPRSPSASSEPPGELKTKCSAGAFAEGDAAAAPAVARFAASPTRMPKTVFSLAAADDAALSSPQSAMSRARAPASGRNLFPLVPGARRVAEASRRSAASATSASSLARREARCSAEQYMCLLLQLSKMTFEARRIHRHASQGKGSRSSEGSASSFRSRRCDTCASKNASKWLNTGIQCWKSP